jgi:hypothetical protein
MIQCFRTATAVGAVVLMAAVMPLSAQYPGAGTTIFDFVNIAYDARTVALSGASAAMPSGCYGVFTNPAALGYVSRMQVAVGYRPIGAGIFGAPLAYVLPENPIGVFGAGIYGLTSGRFYATDKGPDNSVVFLNDLVGADYLAGNVSWARMVNEYFSAGITVKGLYTYIKDIAGTFWSADGIACDAGLQCRFMNARLIYGFVVHNVGLLRSGFTPDDSYPFPSALSIGVSYVPRDIDNLRATIDIDKKRGDYLMFRPAAELEIIKNQMVIRAGYSFSWKDLQAFSDMLSGSPRENYYKSNRSGLGLGAGLFTDIAKRKVQFDAAVEFSAVPLLPALVVSLLVSI